jgi:beta-carotene 3-hydroxylase
VLIGAVAFVLMEPLTYALHRWVMHGSGARLHRSHHRPPQGRWELNDLYPLLISTVVLGLLALGFNLPGFGALVPLGVGATLYGAVYAFVHDVYIHGRVPSLRGRQVGVLDRLAEAHRVHHLYNGEPYGMLLPVVPRRLRARAATTARVPLRRAPEAR